MSLNSIFNQPVPQSSKSVESSSIQQQQRTTKPAQLRKPRSDKLHDIKFPVTIQQRESLRVIAKQMGERETTANSILLHKALSHLPDIPLQDYQDTKRYMHVKLNATDYQRVSDLAIKKDMSERKVVALIMWSLIKRGKRGEF